MNSTQVAMVNDKSSMDRPMSMAGAHQTNQMASIPRMVILERIMKFPVVESAVKKSQNVYGRIKSISPVMGSTLSAAEGMTRRFTVPLVTKFGAPLSAIDHTLVVSLDKLENTIPLVRDTPSDIIRRTEQAISNLKAISLKKTNDALATTGGVRALRTLDAASDRAIDLLDHYLPVHESDPDKANPQEKPEDGVGRAVYAVGKVGRTMSIRLHGKAQRALPTAICSLGLAGPLESLNGKVQEIKSQTKEPVKETKMETVNDIAGANVDASADVNINQEATKEVSKEVTKDTDAAKEE